MGSNTEKICFCIGTSQAFEKIKDAKDLKSAFTDFLIQKSQITWNVFNITPHRKGGYEKCKDNMRKDMPKSISQSILPETSLFSTRLNQEYRIIFSRENNIMMIHWISKHYGDK